MVKREIVLFATPTKSSFTQPVQSALIRLGLQVFSFHDDRPNLTTRVLGFIANSKVSGGLISYQIVRQKTNEALADCLRQIKPNYLLVIKGASIEKKTIDFAKSKGIVTINWFPDCQHVWPWLRENAAVYDHFFTCCLDLIPRLKKIGTVGRYLPYAADPDKELHSFSKRYNIVFIGQYTKRRERYFVSLISLGLDIWGQEGWKTSSLSAFYHGYAGVEEMMKIFRMSKIVVNMTTSEKESGFIAANLRNFEVTGVGTFLLTQSNEAIRRLFRDGKEIVCFTTENDLLIKVRYYLQHEAEREKIAFRGWQRTVRDHTYDLRLKQLLFHVRKNKVAADTFPA